ncbi:hypothetical protein QBC44DRAFT_61426 [Cladorrhinum sp. PSN332]|nr:hypothetical protein QBC44DRAFT_61426 [Cladorrhinum sp. PSN332]
MAGQPDINSILRLIGESTQRGPVTSTPPHGQPGLPAPVQQAAPYGAPPSYPPPQAAQYAPAPYYPQPSGSGSIDLNDIHPHNTGTLSAIAPLNEAIERARAIATSAGYTPYDRQATGYPGPDPRGQNDRGYPGGRSRSRSPRGRDNYRDNFNPYRDERRADHGGQGREQHGRERSFSPRRQGFSPRGAGGGGRERSPLRGNNDNVETMEIEGSMVGLIIGRQGENLRNVERDSGCRVQFIPPSGQNDRVRLCRITGPRPQREEAKEMINRIIRDSGMRGPPGQGGHRSTETREPRPDRNAPPVPKEGEDSLQIMVPDRTVGLIIGRGGETIRDLQERSGCHINIVSESKSVNGLRPVNLIGAPAAAKHAKELILEIVDSDSRNGSNNAMPAGPPRGAPRNDGYGSGGGGGGGGAPGHEKVNDSIYVPSDSVGMIIGKGGETIREMQNSTGCKINVSQSSGPNEVEREIGLVGSRDSIERAKRAIEDKVDAAKQKTSGGGRGGPPRGQHRDYDNPNYGQPSNSSAAPPAPSSNPAAGASGYAQGQADPYAPYGGYQNYLALWMAAANQQPGQVPPGAPPS